NYLVPKGHQINAAAHVGDALLLESCKYGTVDIARYLIQQLGVSAGDASSPHSPLITACLANQPEVARLLVLECGVDPSFALHRAAQEGNIALARFLAEECDAEVNAPDESGYTP